MGGEGDAETDKTSSDAWGRNKYGWRRVYAQERWLGKAAGSQREEGRHQSDLGYEEHPQCQGLWSLLSEGVNHYRRRCRALSLCLRLESGDEQGQELKICWRGKLEGGGQNG